MRIPSLALIATIVCACATTTPANQSGRNPPFRSYVLSGENLAPVRHHDVYAAIESLRPQWLRRGGTHEAVVYVDGVRRGLPAELRTLLVRDVQDLRFLTPADATTRYGTGHMGGAILITTRRGR